MSSPKQKLNTKIEFPEWRTNACLPNCVTAVLNYLKKSKKTRGKKELKTYGTGNLLWPARAAQIISENGLSVKVFDNDINFEEYSSGKMDYIKQKYGQAGVNHMLRNFSNIQKTIKYTKNFLQKHKENYFPKKCDIEYLKENFTEHPNRIGIVNLNFGSIENLNCVRPHYYLLLNYDRKNDIFTLIDPIKPMYLIEKPAQQIEVARESIQNEVLDFIIE